MRLDAVTLTIDGLEYTVRASSTDPTPINRKELGNIAAKVCRDIILYVAQEQMWDNYANEEETNV